MSTEADAKVLARRLDRSVILTLDGRLAVGERHAGTMVGWRCTDRARELLPVDHPRVVAAHWDGGLSYPDGRSVAGSTRYRRW